MKLPLALAAIALAGCTAADLGLAPTSDDPLFLALADKTLVLTDAPEVQVTLEADGTITGFAQGSWRVNDGTYCRTLTAPPGMTGTECPTTELAGDEVTFTSSTGKSTWQIAAR